VTVGWMLSKESVEMRALEMTGETPGGYEG